MKKMRKRRLVLGREFVKTLGADAVWFQYLGGM